MHQNSPAFQDKEERRLITLASMDNLLKFHEIERQEKHNALKFYSAFQGGGIVLIAGMSKLSLGLETELLTYLTLIIIITINFFVAKKLIAVRGASNNIYHEYGRRLRFLLNNYTKDLDKNGLEEIKNTFQKYIDTQKEGPLLPKYSVDTFEVKGILFINILFSLTFWIPINKIIISLGYAHHTAIHLTAAHVAFVIYFAHCILKNAIKMPNVNSKD